MFARKVWAPSLLAAMTGLSGCVTTPALSTMNTQKPVPIARTQLAQQVTLPYRARDRSPRYNNPMSARRARLAQERGIWSYDMRKDRAAAVACLSTRADSSGATIAPRAMGAHSGSGSKWIYRNGHYTRDEQPSMNPALPTPASDAQGVNACVHFTGMLSDQLLQMRSVSAPQGVLRYFRAVKSWAMDCAAMGPADAHCSGGSTLSRLSGLKATAVDALDHLGAGRDPIRN